VIQRLASGLAKQAVHLLEACAPFPPRVATGAPLLLFLAVCVACTRDRRLRGFLALFLTLWIASFAWYAPVVSDRRFLAVLVPIVMPLVAAFTSGLGPRGRRVVRGASLGVACAVGALALAGGALRFRPSRFEPAPWNAELHELVRARTRDVPGAVYVLGPSARLGFDWDDSVAAVRTTSPRDAAGFERLLADSRGGRVRLLVLEAGTDRPRFSDAWLEVDADGALALARAPPGWRVVARWPAERPRTIVMERDEGR
jgi:hypothetical protein